MRKDVSQFLKKLKRQGFTIKDTGGRTRHIKAYPPGGGPYVVISVSPSCHHWRQNAEKWVRKALEGEIETIHGGSKVA